MKITIYTSKGCTWCTKMKELLGRANLDYKEIVWQDLDGDQQVEVGKKYPDMSSFPIAIIDDEYVGGIVPVAKKLVKMGLVSSKKE